MKKSIFTLLFLTISASALVGCSTPPEPAAQTEPAPAASSASAAAPTSASKASPAATIGITEEQLGKIADKSTEAATVTELTEATCKAYADGGNLTDVIREQSGASLTSTKNLTPERKLFFGALASVAGDKIEQNCPEFSDEFATDAKTLLSQ